MQPDTIIPDLSNPQSWNRYSYVTNRPINFDDPTGHVEACLGGCGRVPTEVEIYAYFAKKDIYDEEGKITTKYFGKHGSAFQTYYAALYVAERVVTKWKLDEGDPSLDEETREGLWNEQHSAVEYAKQQKIWALVRVSHSPLMEQLPDILGGGSLAADPALSLGDRSGYGGGMADPNDPNSNSLQFYQTRTPTSTPTLAPTRTSTPTLPATPTPSHTNGPTLIPRRHGGDIMDF